MESILIKHPAYYLEHEYRVFVNLDELNDWKETVDVHYSPKKPFLELSFTHDMLSKIYISPRGDQDQTEKLVRHFLMHQPQLSHVEVVVSDIPFRD